MVCSGKDDMEALLDRLDRLGDRHVIPAHAEWFVELSPLSVTYLEGVWYVNGYEVSERTMRIILSLEVN